MRHHKVIENDIVIEELWEAAQAAGFTDIEFSLQSKAPLRLGYEEYRTFREHGFGGAAAAAPQGHVVAHNRNVTVFHLVRGAPAQLDSRTRDGLVAELRIERVERVEPVSTAGGMRRLKLTVAVRNSSDRVWRRSGRDPGCVNLGVRRLDATGELVDQDYLRHRFDADLAPGGTVTISVELPVPVAASIMKFEARLGQRERLLVLAERLPYRAPAAVKESLATADERLATLSLARLNDDELERIHLQLFFENEVTP